MTTLFSPIRGLMLGAIVALIASPATAQIEVVVREGDVAPGGMGGVFDIINAPFTTGSGALGFTGSVVLPSGVDERFVWFDDEITFLASSALPLDLSGGESTMGVSDTGDFIYSPSVDGNDAVYSNLGVIVREEDPAPSTSASFIAFASRPTMTADGTAHWISGVSDTPTGSTLGRILYESSGAGAGTPTIVVATGMMMGGFPIAQIDFDYDFSDDNQHQILVLDLELPADTLRTIWVDGVQVAMEGDMAPNGDSWDNFDGVSVNDSGDYLFTGDTDGTPDEFIAFNGAIVVLEDDVVDGVPLTGGTLRAASVNNLGQVAHAWGVTGGDEHLFVGDGADLSMSSVRLLSTGDTIDTDGDMMPDATVTDFNASISVGPGLSFASDGFLFVEVDLEDIGTLTETEAILRINVGGGPAPVSFVRGDCNDDGGFDISDVIFLLDVLFVGGSTPICAESCDGNDDGLLDISDAITKLSALFVSGAPALPPPSVCGPDTDGDALECPEFANCP